VKQRRREASLHGNTSAVIHAIPVKWRNVPVKELTEFLFTDTPPKAFRACSSSHCSIYPDLLPLELTALGLYV
jgi:hypothetical protein